MSTSFERSTIARDDRFASPQGPRRVHNRRSSVGPRPQASVVDGTMRPSVVSSPHSRRAPLQGGRSHAQPSSRMRASRRTFENEVPAFGLDFKRARDGDCVQAPATTT